MKAAWFDALLFDPRLGAKTAYPVEALWNAAGNYKFRGAQI